MLLFPVPAQEETGIPGSDYGLTKSFGSCDDEVCYEQEQEDFITGVNTLDANLSGGDGSIPEAQTIALVRAAEDWAWRDGVLKVPNRLRADCFFLLLGHSLLASTASSPKNAP